MLLLTKLASTGQVDVFAMTMSLRSRLATEVTYALNTLQILAAGVGAPGGFQFFLAPCEDLFPELLDLLEETAFTRPQPESALPERVKARGHLEWIRAAKADEADMREWRRRKAARKLHESDRRPEDIAEREEEPPSESREETSVVPNGQVQAVDDEEEEDEEDIPDAEKEEKEGHWNEERYHRDKARDAATAVTILNIIRGLAAMPGNFEYLCNQHRMFVLFARLSRAGERALEEQLQDSDEGSSSSSRGEPDTPFTLAEMVRVRKDILMTIATLSEEHLSLETLPEAVVLAIFDLVVSFVMDAQAVIDLEGPLINEHQPRGYVRRVPMHADLALEAFSKFACLDDNRRVLCNVIPADDVYDLGMDLVRLLPVTAEDFDTITTEARLANLERIGACLFHIAFFAPQTVKKRFRESPAITNVVFLALKRLLSQARDFRANPFADLARRLSGILQLLNDGTDLFTAPDLLGLGVVTELPTLGRGSTLKLGRSSLKHASGLLLDREDQILELFRMTANLDPSIVSELDALCAV